MDKVNQIAFNTSSILNIPLQKYEEDFTFVVNGKYFKTSRVVADLLSSKVVQLHFSDPTLNEYSFQTNQNGDFQKILDFIIFHKVDFDLKDIPYVLEILEILENQSFQIINDSSNTEISLDSVFNSILQHERYNIFYSSQLAKDIEYISQNFYSLKENHIQIFKTLKLGTIELILNNPNLQLESEDQLISIINQIYSENNNYAALYDNVKFFNVTKEKMSDFLNIFSVFDITQKTWQSLSYLIQKSSIDTIELAQKNSQNNRYHVLHENIKFEKGCEFKGIIQYLKKLNQNKLNDVIEITASSVCDDSEIYSFQHAIEYDDLESYFESEDRDDSWICFDFKDKKLKLENYTLRSFNKGKSSGHLKSWVIEASNDENKKDWKIVDKHENCDLLQGQNFVHTFSVQNENKESFRYIRLRQIGQSWSGNKYLNLNSIEFYGDLIKF